ncbi:hypothetical protein ACFXAE_13030 [Streptomyces sp. NPDC059454]|uniref:hypothetical protein n=1 Tax=Streptomyces sp. NPDC059454 TaxID=3346836 RepID=UPI00367C1B3F
MTRLAARGQRPRRAGPGGFDRRPIAPMILGSILNPVNSSMLAAALVPIGRASRVRDHRRDLPDGRDRRRTA